MIIYASYRARDKNRTIARLAAFYGFQQFVSAIVSTLFSDFNNWTVERGYRGVLENCLL